LHYSIRTVRQVSLLVREHMLNLQMRHPAIRRLISRVGRAAIPGLLAVKQADLLAHSTDLILQTLPEWDAFRARLSEVLAEDATFNLSDLVINGTDLLDSLACQPGPLIGAVLKALWDEVLVQPQKNQRSYLRGDRSQPCHPALKKTTACGCSSLGRITFFGARR
jgi:poly(A) polymerase/tRNA nucleotidyltransferase (CCA-adding enzyme)